MTYKFVNYLWDDARRVQTRSRWPARLSLESAGQRSAHHQHRRRQYFLEDQRKRIRSPAKRPKCFGSRDPAAICAPRKRENFSSLYQQKLIDLQKLYAKRKDKGLKSQAEDDMVAMYFHATFNLNPRACSIDTPLH